MFCGLVVVVAGCEPGVVVGCEAGVVAAMVVGLSVESSSGSGGTNRPPRVLPTNTDLEGGGSGGEIAPRYSSAVIVSCHPTLIAIIISFVLILFFSTTVIPEECCTKTCSNHLFPLPFFFLHVFFPYPLGCFLHRLHRLHC